MSLERATMAFAGAMVLLSLALTAWVHPLFFWLTAFVGANLLQSAFTRFCPAAMLMHRLGVRSERELLEAETPLRQPEALHQATR